MKRIFTLLMTCLMCCLVSAQVYYYIPREIDPASNRGDGRSVFVVVKDNSSNLWLYHVNRFSDNDEPLAQLKEFLMQDVNGVVNFFNRSTFVTVLNDGTEYRSLQDMYSPFERKKFLLGGGCYKLYFKQKLTKCYVYKYRDIDLSFSLDFNILVHDSSSGNPTYYKRCSIEDFKLRRSADDLF